MAPPEPSSPTKASPGYPNTPGKHDLDLKSQVCDADGGLHKGLQKEHK